MNPEVRIWKIEKDGIGHCLNAMMLSHGGKKVLINPISLNDESFQRFIKQESFDAVYLSNHFCAETALKLRRELKIPVMVHELAAERLSEKPDSTFRDGEELLCRLKVIHLREQKSPGECVFFWPERKTLFGSALIGQPDGSLQMHPSVEYADRRKAQAGLRRLFSLNFESFYPVFGEVVLRDAYGALEKCFERLK